MSVLVLLRVWVLYNRTLGITIALLVAFILYLGASIAMLVYILSGMHCKSSRSRRIT